MRSRSYCPTCVTCAVSDDPSLIPSSLSSVGRDALRELIKNHYDTKISESSLDGIASRIYNNLDKVSTPPVTSMELMVSEMCNLRCDYCFEGVKSGRYMNPDTARHAADFLLTESQGSSHLAVLFFGGEPLLNFECIRETVFYLEERAGRSNQSIRWSVTTNGTICDDIIAQFLLQHNFGVMLSIDGDPKTHNKHRYFERGHGSFDMIERNFQYFRDIPNLEIRVTVVPDVSRTICNNVIYLIEKFHPSRLVIGPAWGIHWSHRAYKIYAEEMKRIITWFADRRPEGVALSILEDIQDAPGWGCRAGKGSICVTADGKIFPCSAFIGSPILYDYVLGNIHDGWTRMPRRREFLLLNAQRGPQCLECRFAGICNGGCPVQNAKMTGNFVKPDPLVCQETQNWASLCRLWIDQTQNWTLQSPSYHVYALGAPSAKIKRSTTREPEVSVIMPTYQHAPYIQRAIRSVLQQTFTNWELLIIDDASPDNTREKVASFLKDPRIYYFYNEENIGEWASVIKALDYCRGKYIAYIHSDDIWYPIHLQVLYDYLEANPDKAIAYTAMHCNGRYAKHLEFSVKCGKEIESITAEQDICGREKELIKYGNIMIPIQVMHRRECLEKHKPPTRADDERAGKTHKNPDGRLWAKFLEDYEIGFINVSTVQWMIHGENHHLTV